MRRARMSLRPMVAALAIASATPSARAEQPMSRVGVRVIERPATTVIDREDWVTTPDRQFIVFRVVEDAGDMLRLRGEGRNRKVDRWRKAVDVVPLAGAVAYLTDRGLLDPAQPDWLFYRGLVRIETKDYDGALSDFDAYLRLAPERVQGLVGRAFVLELKGELDKALDDLDEAIRLDPRGADARRNRGWVRKSKGDHDGALSDFDAYLRLKPEDSDVYLQRGDAWSLKGEYDKAICDFDDAIRLEPQLALAFCSRGRAWMLKGDLDRAIRDEDEAIRLAPKYVEAYGHRGWAYQRRGDPDKAIADFTEAIRLAPEDARGYFSRGYVRTLQDAFEGAIEDLSESVRLDPSDHQSLNARAWIWANGPDARLRDGPRAVSSAARACDLAGWRNPSYLTTLAAAYAEMGDFAAAVQWQERSLLLQENEDERRRGLWRLALYKAGKPDRIEPKD